MGAVLIHELRKNGNVDHHPFWIEQGGQEALVQLIPDLSGRDGKVTGLQSRLDQLESQVNQVGDADQLDSFKQDGEAATTAANPNATIREWAQ